MSRPTFPLSIDRRGLLTSAVAATTARIVPLGGSAKAGAVQTVVAAVLPPSLTPEASPGNVSAATACRLLEIARRNEIRREAELPLLSKAKELRRMKEQEELEEFERFEATHGDAVLEQVLQQRRRAEGNPNWRPNWMDGMVCQNQVCKILGQQLREACRTVS